MAMPKISCGLEFNHVYELTSALQDSGQNGYDFVSVPLVHPRFVREHVEGKAKLRPGAFTRSDLILSSSEWASLIVGRLSSNVCLRVDSRISCLRANNVKCLTQELEFASHLGIAAIMVPLQSPQCFNLARIIYDKVAHGVGYQIWVRVPLISPRDQAQHYRSDIQKESSSDTWSWWNRWLGEPVRCAVLPTSIWLTNKKGFPVLSRAHQELVKYLYIQHAQFVITGALRHAHIKLYQQYLEHILRTSQSKDPLIEFARGYEDYLQCPLQPLMDNLESQTYEVFEKDPIKYSCYENAIYQALLDRVSDDKKEEIEIILMVVGAGRGPIVQRALSAAKLSGRKIKMYAVEKNPNAVVTLQAQKDELWGDQVTVVCCDMRKWIPPEKADILISELLGSFGDNELSPECLDGAQKFLKDDGISIPYSYTSYLSPLQSPKIYDEIRQCRDKDKHFLAHFETPYVVYLHNKLELSPSQPLFTFVHPNKDSNIDNSRYECLQFMVSSDSVVHGLAGYFETVLYKDIKLSIRPETHSPGMFSWFPIVFPMKEPIAVMAGNIFEVHFWRCVSSKNVWYEWCVTSPHVTPIHNPNGRAYTIGL